MQLVESWSSMQFHLLAEKHDGLRHLRIVFVVFHKNTTIPEGIRYFVCLEDIVPLEESTTFEETPRSPLAAIPIYRLYLEVTTISSRGEGSITD